MGKRLEYDHYDPMVEGYGSPDQWRAAFEERLRPKSDSMTEKDALEILGLTSPASADEIKRAYRSKIHQWHPDKHSNSGQATEMTAKIRDAYDILTSTGSDSTSTA